jgi:hypothetical protein
MTFLLRTYEVLVNGFAYWGRYEGASPGQARAKAWHAYCSYRWVSFREFLSISTLRRATDADGFGRQITVGGAPAHWVGHNGQYVRFVRPGETTVLLSHPLDVAEVPHG